jgi:hypothetical protein
LEISFLQKIPRENFHAKRLHMNERIRELMIKADYPAPELALRAQALVDLILQDCMSICEEQGDKGLDGHYCVDKIRREFGV